MAIGPKAESGLLLPALAILLSAALGLAGCGGGSDPAGVAVPELLVEYAGCDGVLRDGVLRDGLREGPICVLAADRRLRLWIRSDADAAVELVGVAAGAEPVEEVQQGLRYEVEIPSRVSRLTVRALRRGSGASWHLALRKPAPPEWLEQFLALYRGGEHQPAERLLRERLAGLPASERGKALGLLARVELGKGHNDEALGYFEEALLWHREAGRTSDLVDDATALTYLLLYHAQDLPRARAVLDALPVDWQGPAEASYYLSYYRGLLAKENGDLRTALRQLEAAVRQAERLDLTRLRQSAEHPLAVMLQRVGRYAEAEAVARRLWNEAPAELVGCARAQLLNNLAWARLLAREAGEAADDPTPLLEETLDILRHQGCSEVASEQVNVLLNLALAHLHEGRTRAARERLDEAAALGDLAEPRLELWRLEVEGRLALRVGRPRQALACYTELADRAATGAALEADWRAAVGEAQARDELGESEQALAALARADALLDEMSFAVALREGRETFVARHHRATRLYLDLLLAAGRPAEALAVARRSRARILRRLERQDRLAGLSLAEQQTWSRAVVAYRSRRDALEQAAAGDWRLPDDDRRRARAEREEQRRRMLQAFEEALAVVGERHRNGELPSPEDGELLLAYHPLRQGWAGFAADRHGVAAERLLCVEEGLPSEDLARCLLQPFADRIERAEIVRVLPYGSLRTVDFHALPFGADVLLAARPVVYPLDLERGGAGDGGDGRRQSARALVVADPGGDLPAARAEARAVATVLRSFDGAWEIVSLGGEQAGGDAVRRGLSEADGPRPAVQRRRPRPLPRPGDLPPGAAVRLLRQGRADRQEPGRGRLPGLDRRAGADHPARGPGMAKGCRRSRRRPAAGAQPVVRLGQPLRRPRARSVADAAGGARGLPGAAGKLLPGRPGGGGGGKSRRRAGARDRAAVARRLGATARPQPGRMPPAVRRFPGRRRALRRRALRRS
jgi:tetratricopeptide (TPR) repeat protein